MLKEKKRKKNCAWRYKIQQKKINTDHPQWSEDLHFHDFITLMYLIHRLRVLVQRSNKMTNLLWCIDVIIDVISSA